MVILFVFFFFQAEDGIRDDLVTGVQTCALPIWSRSWIGENKALMRGISGGRLKGHPVCNETCGWAQPTAAATLPYGLIPAARSEERRVGKECRSRWSR